VHIRRDPTDGLELEVDHEPSPPHLTGETRRFDAPRTDRPIVCIVLASIPLRIAVRFMKRTLAPIGALSQAVTAAVVVALVVGSAIVFVAAAAFSIH
jgi:hypothetical protein